MRRRHGVYELPQLVDLPTGNVHVLPLQRATTDGTAAAPVEQLDALRQPPTGEWEIHDGDGVVLQPTLPSRAEALRLMCVVALRGISLPLTLHGPDGLPTGDRLA